MIYLPSKEFRFIEGSKKCCIGFIDLVNSTVDTLSIIDEVKIQGYYSLFINTLSKIIKRYDGQVVKNIGDCLLFYFPKTSKSDNPKEFNKVIECFFEILDNRSTINEHLIEENLPSFGYRITIDYGKLDFALTGPYNQIDIFGSVVNICSKLNSCSISNPNKITIGSNLYHFLSSFPIFSDMYDFSFSEEYSIDANNFYELYTVTKKMGIKNLKNEPSIFRPSFYSNNVYESRHTITENYKKSVSRLPVENQKNISKKIMIIDDDKNIVLTFKSILENNNENNDYDITTFTDPELALQYFKENLYSFHNNNKDDENISRLIILDIRMKKINGIQLYKQLKALDSSIKILFVTGLDIIDEIKSMIPGLTDDQIKKKPVEEEIFLKTVNKLLCIN